MILLHEMSEFVGKCHSGTGIWASCLGKERQVELSILVSEIGMGLRYRLAPAGIEYVRIDPHCPAIEDVLQAPPIRHAIPTDAALKIVGVGLQSCSVRPKSLVELAIFGECSWPGPRLINNLKQSSWVNRCNGAGVHIAICTNTTFEAERIALHIPADARVVIAEVVVDFRLATLALVRRATSELDPGFAGIAPRPPEGRSRAEDCSRFQS
jgi:hypothetical protein